MSTLEWVELSVIEVTFKVMHKNFLQVKGFWSLLQLGV